MRRARRLYIGALVELTDDRMGVVVDLNGGETTRPVVRLLLEPGRPLSELDLAKHRDVDVRRVIEAT